MPANYTVKSLHKTVLKKTPLQSALLSPDQKIIFPKGQDLKALSVGERDKKNGHVRITFDFASLPTDTDPVAKELQKSGLNTWWLWPGHLGVEGTEPDNKPKDTPVTDLERDRTEQSPYFYRFKLPGNRSQFNMANEIVKGSRCYWYEALHLDIERQSYRPPEDSVVVNNIVKLARFWRDVARPYLAKKYGVPESKVSLIINSWYRDPATNRRVGGASRSRHLWGDAIDFRILIDGKEMSPYDINKYMEPIAQTCGLASASCFTHLDLRGFFARWNYPF